ncbi:PaaI family thioesterase [Aeromicrobium sp. Root495]|uniref:PaaI family thioesterase n=1 Tax=Aeromicrobium sp. Root495 TaxID=1736550 RepID=UPI001910F687|nr:PaaI family thioesterase [Aeromicrobium sp. Root495]
MSGQTEPQGRGDDQADIAGDANNRERADVISRWSNHLVLLDAVEVGQVLPPHSLNCAGCGPDNPSGLGMQVIRTANGVESTHSFGDGQVGAPGIAHGGAVALAFDDLFGFALYTVGTLAVTRSLTVEYQAPFRLYQPYKFNAEVVERTGRRLLLHADAWDSAGRKAGSADATFVVVESAHFAAAPPDHEVGGL